MLKFQAEMTDMLVFGKNYCCSCWVQKKLLPCHDCRWLITDDKKGKSLAIDHWCLSLILQIRIHFKTGKLCDVQIRAALNSIIVRYTLVRSGGLNERWRKKTALEMESLAAPSCASTPASFLSRQLMAIESNYKFLFLACSILHNYS